MKLLVLSISAIVLAGTTISCKKLIEIPGNPPTLITKEQQFADSASTLSVVAGVYAYGQGKGFGYSDANFTVATGLSADELAVSDANSDYAQFYSYTLTPLSRAVPNLWEYPYRAIYQVNDVLDGITNNKNLSASFIDQVTGEMKVVRALYYFNLVHLFGGVPLVTSVDYRATSRLARSSVEAVYDQVIADLTDAVAKLPDNYVSPGRIRPNRYAAKALLARIYLYKGEWEAAFKEADDVIKSNMYSIENVPVNTVFLEGSNEAIWQIPVKNSYLQTAEAQNFVPSGSSTPRYLVTQFLLDRFEPGDLRLQSWIGSTIVNGNTLHYPFKYKNRQASNTPVENYMVLRLAEVLLIRAEAAAQLNHLDAAVSDIDVIRSRAGLPATNVDVNSREDVLNAVMQERQLELCFEWGHRWFDLKRNVTAASSAATVLGVEKTGYHTNAALYPIPEAQRQLNNLLEQNNGYN